MEALIQIPRFGTMVIPALSSGNLTATYQAFDWQHISGNCNIRMYQTEPGSDRPTDLPPVTIQDWHNQPSQ